MSDECKIKILTVNVQENGIIRNLSGYMIGRLYDRVSFDSEYLNEPPVESVETWLEKANERWD